ncbi:hypothetical protein NDU88_002170 [Pleurodeles waltl]|uniref:Uncharacterized protein n=1 Tax=Pleurodeles waltl TaxID=8319 RepID=A0AAV7UY53_PLEWA|nr:hypothetical protein NDU88_002170 [Pleurodeles waltl]
MPGVAPGQNGGRALWGAVKVLRERIRSYDALTVAGRTLSAYRSTGALTLGSIAHYFVLSFLNKAGSFKDDAIGSKEVDLEAWFSTYAEEKQLTKTEAGASEKKEELSQGIPQPKEDTEDADQRKEPATREARMSTLVAGSRDEEEERIRCGTEIGRWLSEYKARAVEREPHQST